MTDYLSIQQAMDQGSGPVSIRGWVWRERGSKKLKFIVLRDSTNVIQCVIARQDVGDENFEIADKVQIETSMELRGEIKKDDRAPTGYEILVKDFKVIGESDTFPLGKDQSREFLDDNRHLTIRTRRMTAIMRVRATVMDAFREHYKMNGFVEYSPPIFQPSQCEGGATLFEVKYYDKAIYLTQSAQLYSEAMTFGLDKVFVMSPTFRAEKSKTSRHLSEFWMAEMEAAWMDLDGLQDDVEALLKHIVKRVLTENKKELAILERDVTKLQPVVDKPFNRMTYTQVLEMLKEKDGMEVEWGKDLRTVEEEKLSDHFDVPTIVTRYPSQIMAFYKPNDPKDDKVALCLDVIAPEHYGEIVGGSQRDLDVARMSKKLEAMGENPSNYTWYFDLRKYGSVPHSGHGMGVERVVAWVCGLDNIKDAIPFPRTMTRYTP
ncbi:TPA: asparagine--tRNA ligase [Candidatus Woesearchaeota archaeon]|nr:asparagine--tRNA ligase [Candidatus Woesearchaeota archaeon]